MIERLYVGGRQSGKTSALILELARHPDAVMLVFTEAEARRLRAEFPAMADRIHSSADSEVGWAAPVIIDNLELLNRMPQSYSNTLAASITVGEVVMLPLGTNHPRRSE